MPTSANSGIRFYRTDLPQNQTVKAHMDKVVDTRLATTIGEGGAVMATTEHLLAAINSFGIDNSLIELDSAEVPIMDGSAVPFMHLLRSAGKQRLANDRKFLKITKEIQYSEDDKHINRLSPRRLKSSREIVFDDTLIRSQWYSIDLSTERFIKEISRERTFGYVEQVEELWANGLALGGTLESVIAIHRNRKSVLNEDGLRYKDEFIRHKVLDIIGDMALLGCPLHGHVTAYKTGHTQHLAFMQAIADSPDCWELVEIKENGAHAVLEQVHPGSRVTAEGFMMPYLKQTTATAP